MEGDDFGLAHWVPRLFQARPQVRADHQRLLDQAFWAIQLLRLPAETPWPTAWHDVSPVDWHERCWQASRLYEGELAVCLMVAAQVFLALGAQAQTEGAGARLDPPEKAWLTDPMTSFFSPNEAGRHVTHVFGCDSPALLWFQITQMQLVVAMARQRQVLVGLDAITLPFHQVVSVRIRRNEAALAALMTVEFLPSAVVGYLDTQVRQFQRQHAWWRSPRRRWRLMRQKCQVEQVTDTARQNALHLVRLLFETLSSAPESADVLRSRV